MKAQDNKYSKKWEEIKKYENKSLNSSALKLANQIYNEAENDNNEKEIVKALFYIIRYNNILDENNIVSSIQKTQNDIISNKFDDKKIVLPFLHLALANLYKNYYQQNKFIINQRSIVADYENDDFETWDKNKFFNKIIYNTNLALNDNLKSQQINDFLDFFANSKNSDLDVLPSLYDVVANEILNIYETLKYYNNTEKLSNDELFSDAENFIKIAFSNDSLSYLNNSIQIYQKWLAFRLENKNKQSEAFIYCDIRRLNFLNNNFSNAEHSNILWEKAIENLKNYFDKKPESVYINNSLAEYYIGIGNSFNFKNNNNYNTKNAKIKAMEILEKSIANFPDAKYSDKTKYLIEEIKQKKFSFKSEEFINVNRNFPIRIEFKNLQKLYLYVFECDYNNFRKIGRYIYGDEQKQKLTSKIKSLKLVFSESIELPETQDYNFHSTKHLVNQLSAGSYLILLCENKDDLSKDEPYLNYQFVQVADIAFLQNKDIQNNYLILNSANGQAIENAKVNLCEINLENDKLEKKFSYTSDNQGRIEITDKTNYYSYILEIISGNEKIYYNKLFSNYYFNNQIKTNNITNIFTDRAIYRPGQTIHFKTISYTQTDNINEIAKNHNITAKLFDVNNQIISTLNLVTNDFASASGDFIIPQNILTGNLRIEIRNDSDNKIEANSYIKVEEYKRPNFEIFVENTENEYKINDTITINGSAKSYSGVALPNAKISYSVTRQMNLFRYYWWLDNTSTDDVIAFGETTSDENGNFSINFKAIVEENNIKNNNIYYDFVAKITVSDITGETHVIEKNIFVSNIGMHLSLYNDKIIKREEAKEFKIYSRNLAGADIDADVEIIITKLFSPQAPLRSDLLGIIDLPLYEKYDWYKNFPGNVYDKENELEFFNAQKIIYKNNINTKDTKSFLPEDFSNWENGAYRIDLKSKDSFGNIINYDFEFVLFSDKSKEMPYITPDFFYCNNTSLQPGDTANIKIGSSYRNVNAYFTIVSKNKIIKKENFVINAEIKDIAIPIIEDYRGDISFNIFFVFDGRIYNHSQNIYVEYKNKKLNFKYFTLRDLTVEPRQEITASVTVLDQDSLPVNAEFLANLYDASLDVFSENYWNFWPYKYYHTYFSNEISQNVNNSIIRNPSTNKFYYKYYNLPQLQLLNLIEYHRSNMLYKSRAVNYRVEGAAAPVSNNVVMEDIAVEEAESSNAKENLKITSDADIDENGNTENNIRSDFSENAFFFPNLRTDENGKIEFKFTMPDALTRWNFMGLAHTQDMKIAQISASIISQKALMLTPNIPRFLRENDIITIKSKIDNITDNKITGKAKIEIYNAETLEKINNLFEISNYEKDFCVDSNSNTIVEWRVKIPEGISAVEIQITAESEKHIDGEKHIIPILSNKMLVTEAISLPVNKAGTTKFEFKSLKENNSNTLRNEKFILEYSPNPAWYAVQALPYLMEHPFECNEETFSRYFANKLASHIANSNPKIKEIFNIWKSNPDSNSLLSNLEKNQELKSLLIEETPWLLDAKNESENKGKLAFLFDIERMANETNDCWKKLEENQNSDGGWSWFDKNDYSSTYITQHIVAGLGHLEKLGVENTQNQNSIKKAIAYIDKEIVKYYKELQKYNDNYLNENCLSPIAIHYLYTRSFYKNIEISVTTKTAFNYFIKQCEKYWTERYSFYEKGMIALVLYRLNKTETAYDILAALKENAFYNQEMGMYWKYTSGWYWYEAPIETQALLIEVFSEINKEKNTNDIEEMKTWLLKQKQTQNWKTTKATSEAIYALLLQGNDILTKTDYPIIKIGNETIDTKDNKEIKAEAGSGYFKKIWNKNEISKDFANISLKKDKNSVSWGALYWQYFENLNNIKTFKETPLKINKKLFVERYKDNKPVIVPIENDILKIGDKVTVRIEISVDRDMEYLHLKDMRAACFEPINSISGYKYSAGLSYYQSTKDASMNFFIDRLNKGVYVFEYQLIVMQQGIFSNGITTMQSMYAPEFTSHSEGDIIRIDN